MTDGSSQIPATVTTVAADGTTLARQAGAPAPARWHHVDALARAALTAQRAGGRLRVTGAAADLRGLIELAGLAKVLGLEPCRQPEVGKDVRADEVVQRADPAL